MGGLGGVGSAGVMSFGGGMRVLGQGSGLRAPGVPVPGAAMGLQAPPRTTSTVHVSGFPADKTSVDDLYNLFGVYGDILRVKIFFKKRDTAVVQYMDPLSVERAVQFLNGATLFGSPLRVTPSSIANVQLPAASGGAEDPPLTRDYSMTTTHRYGGRGATSKALKHVSRPTPVLHLSNLPDDTSEGDIANLLQPHGEFLCYPVFCDAMMFTKPPFPPRIRGASEVPP